MCRPGRHSNLLGRDRQVKSIDQLLQAVRCGHGGAIAFRGEPGMGKTALLDHAARAGDDMQVTRVAGIQSELGLQFAGLHQLLIPLMARLDRLAAGQGAALGSAFGFAPGPAPSPDEVVDAVLSLLAEAGRTQPLLCIVDDAQWLDLESGEALASVASRLRADPVAMLFAIDESAEATTRFQRVTSTELAGLNEAQAAGLLAATTGAVIDERVAQRIAAETRGNPLALVELAGKLSPDQLAGTSVLPRPLPVGERLQARFLDQVRILVAPARMLLVLCALEPRLGRRLLQRAARLLDLNVDGLLALGAGRFLHDADEVSFRHPLMRSAVYGGATAAERRRAHAALAAACDPAQDPDRHAWHRAAAALGPDESVALDLEHAADRARARGGYATTVALLERAVQLTADDSARAGRILAAARADLVAGALGSAQARLDATMAHLRDARSLADAHRLQGAINFACGDAVQASAVLLRAAEEYRGIDVRLARSTLLEALDAALWAGHLIEGVGLREVAEAVGRMPRAPAESVTAGDRLLDGLSDRVLRGYPPAVATLRGALEALRSGEPDRTEGLRWLGLGCDVAGELWQEEVLLTLTGRWVAEARDAGARTTLPRALAARAGAEVLAGRLDSAEVRLAEAREAAEAIGLRGVLGQTPPQELLLAAWRGDAVVVPVMAESAVPDAVSRGHGKVITFAHYALCVLELGRGNYEAALVAGQRVSEADLPYLGTRVLPDLVEAAVRAGAVDVAEAACARLSDRATASGSPLARGLEARSRALLSADAVADAHYAEAVGLLIATQAVSELARTHLLYGEWLRRRRRRREARRELRLAQHVFDRMGARGFAQRAELELLATAEHARRRNDDTAEELTARERHVAELAAQGASNSEIAAQLVISSNTVAYHLRKVYRKLDVKSRRRLAAALSSVRPPGAG